MSERSCIRGCVYRDGHTPGCAGDVRSASYAGERCTGCEPAPALEGALICEHCMNRLRRTLTDAPDLCAHLRSLIDPSKAAVYDQEKLGGKPPSESQPPMSADLVDAADAVLQILVYWARYFGDITGYRKHADGFRSTISIEQAHGVAQWATDYLLANLETIANDTLVRLFAAAVIDSPADPDPKSSVEWTIAKALRRWPMTERPRFARLPCPGCELRTVLVRPPRSEGDERLYECTNEACGWRPPREETDLWVLYFEAAGVPA